MGLGLGCGFGLGLGVWVRVRVCATLNHACYIQSIDGAPVELEHVELLRLHPLLRDREGLADDGQAHVARPRHPLREVVHLPWGVGTRHY